MIEKVEEKTYITYQYARFYKRVLANVIDFLFFLLCFGVLFISIRAIVNNSSQGRSVSEQLRTIRLDSGLYVEVASRDNVLMDVIAYNNEFDPAASQKRNNAIRAIENFLTYCDELFNNPESEYYNPSNYDVVYNSYLDYFLNEDLLYTNSSNISAPYFDLNNVDENGFAIESEVAFELGAKYIDFYENCYSPYINEVLQGYLITIIPNYYDLTKFSSDMLFYVELPISYCLSGILIYFIPTLIFKRGRKTFGKAIYKIGLINKNMVNPSFKISLARFCIFYFLELLLAPFTFLIPFIISFTLMVFSKKRQGFCDYMLNLCEVDTTSIKIFYDIRDAKINMIDKPTKDINFKQRDNL